MAQTWHVNSPRTGLPSMTQRPWPVPSVPSEKTQDKMAVCLTHLSLPFSSLFSFFHSLFVSFLPSFPPFPYWG